MMFELLFLFVHWAMERKKKNRSVHKVSVVIVFKQPTIFLVEHTKLQQTSRHTAEKQCYQKRMISICISQNAV